MHLARKLCKSEGGISLCATTGCRKMPGSVTFRGCEAVCLEGQSLLELLLFVFYLMDLKALLISQSSQGNANDLSKRNLQLLIHAATWDGHF